MRNEILVYAIASASLIFGFLIFTTGVNAFASELAWEDISRGNNNVRSALLDYANPDFIYIGTPKAVLKSQDAGKSWRSVLVLPSAAGGVNCLSFDPGDSGVIYAATSAGLYRSLNKGDSWKRIFRGGDTLQSECTSLGISEGNMYLGTKAGLFISRDRGRNWQRQPGIIGKSQVTAIACIEGRSSVYLACSEGVFVNQDKGDKWDRVFVTASVEPNDYQEEADEENEPHDIKSPDISHIIVTAGEPVSVYLATCRGVYRRQDNDAGWEPLCDYGLLSRDVRFLAMAKEGGILYAATKTAIFLYRNNRWHELSLRLDGGDINLIISGPKGYLYAACGKGLYKANAAVILKDSQDNESASLPALKDKEPAIRQVQEAAIKYAEVGPEKIIKWRKQAAKKALLPQISVGIDRNTNDLWHWEGGSTTKSEDDILRRGRDSLDWDVSLTWNLGELIWNDDQTSIDVRSKLMVQTRHLYISQFRI
ncbi:MAG: hypothetical protein WC510_02085 [Candidatus Omnitrophota bacterium]